MNKPRMKGKKSSFVNAIAWMSMIFSALVFFSAFLQTLIIYTVLTREQIIKAFSDPQISGQMPELFIIVLSNLHIIAPFFMLISILFFVVSLGLLNRKNWARVIFIVFLLLGIMLSVLALIYQHKYMPAFPDLYGDLPGIDPEDIIKSAKIFNIILNIVHVVLFGWIVKKLSSVDIKAEFIKKY